MLLSILTYNLFIKSGPFSKMCAMLRQYILIKKSKKQLSLTSNNLLLHLILFPIKSQILISKYVLKIFCLAYVNSLYRRDKYNLSLNDEKFDIIVHASVYFIKYAIAVNSYLILSILCIQLLSLKILHNSFFAMLK